MIKCELLDGTTRYLKEDRVVMIGPGAEEGLVVSFAGADGATKHLKISRFQIVKQGTWYD